MTTWSFIRVLVLAITARLVGAQTCAIEETPADMLGPFYLKGSKFTTRLAPAAQLNNVARRIKITGRVYGDNCVPMKSALVEVWHAGIPDASGNQYSIAGSDLRYRGQFRTGACGRYSFTTIYPTLYASRPIRHIHYRVSSGGKLLLVSQLYFKGAITAGFNPDTTQIVQLKRISDGSRTGTFNIYVGTTGTGNATACVLN
ncbi:dioxygenase [Fragilaria crotonensis]|nr:dioxygenase [Fragilaria crotonensis]